MIEDIAFNLIEISDDEIELVYDREAERRIKCICGAVILKQNAKKHDLSKRHIKYLDKLLSKNVILTK